MKQPLSALFVVVLTGLTVAAPRQDVPLDALLDRLASYVGTYEEALSAVVSEEHYLQRVTGQAALTPPTRRELKSDFLLTKATDLGWVAFRDVFEVDGKPVQGRNDRLVELFVKPTGDSMTQVNRIVEESAKHNLGWIRRTVNVPTTAFRFAKREAQRRSQWQRGGLSKVGDIEMREVRFTEREMPRMIQTVDNAAAQGNFWIDEESGRVHRTEMRIDTGETSVVIGVSYAPVDSVDVWMPVVMSERYSTPRQGVITGRAVYENFRRFNVTVATIIKK
jgi:hypothetical protein